VPRGTGEGVSAAAGTFASWAYSGILPSLGMARTVTAVPVPLEVSWTL
jgi:hypothetical protein